MLLQHVLHGNMKHVDHSKRCCDDEHLLRKREWRDLRALLVSFAFVVSNMSLVSWKNERGWQVQGNYRLTIHFLCLCCPSNLCRRRPYRVECTGSLLTSEVKQRRARSVLGWGTAWEDLRVLSAFLSLRCVVLLCRSLGEQSVSRGVHGQSQQ